MLKHFFIFSFIAFCISSTAQQYRPLKDTAAFRQKVENMSSSTNNIESDFVQTKDLKVLSEKIISKGHFVFQKKNKLRWQYVSPYSYIIVLSENKVLIKDEDHKVKKYDLSTNKVFKEINDIMLSCVNGEILNSPKFKISYFENDKDYKLELVPNSAAMRESLAKVILYFDKQISSVIRLDMIEKTGDQTKLEFLNKKINAPISPDNFLLR
jgi:outer membrane lipoprotein-sorting protein